MKFLPLLLLCSFVSASAKSQDFGGTPPPVKARDITEVFHVSRVGRPKAAETREQLIDFYREIETKFNAKAVEEFRAKAQAFAGTRVRVIEDMEKSEDGLSLYLVAYQGQPSVFAASADVRMEEGELTIPLEIVEAGTHQTTVTRIEVEQEDARGAPSLETADTGGATFFGIPVGGGSSSPPPQEEPESGPKFKRTVVTEVKTLPKFRASPSQVVMETPPVFSKDIFLNSVKNGELFEVERLEDRRCGNCGGFKRVQSNLPFGQRATDGKMACPECREKGTVPWNVTYRVTW